MNNGGGANTHPDNEHASTNKPADDGFGLAVARVAVAQICESVGFEGSRGSTLDSLADIAVRYIRDIGMASRFYSNLAGRCQCNVFDIIRTLEDLGNFQGFSCASAVRNCIAGSGTMKDIMEHVEMAEEIPFAHTLPWFPIARERRPIPSFDRMGEIPPGNHIPSWLPALPDPHTYKRTLVWNERKPDPRAEKLEQVKQRRKAERALLNLQQRMAIYGQGGASASSYVPNVDVKGTQFMVKEGSVKFAPPLQMGEEDVSVLNVPDVLADRLTTENHGSIMEAFVSAIDAMRDQFSDDANGDEVGRSKVLPDRRHSVRFKFKMSKKVLGHSLDLDIRNRIIGKHFSVIEREEERDDKKRRAACILKQSMENPEELTQL
ncbi:hypothetical protein SAY87_009032 [Trapa incisa]|uniref:Transcription initiation factor TFIID subunit 8 n=1 Tax=Trapa incisa TaxID=236973 RepID=A0AAN7JZ66_9MYRT|nr:hypothetical protein SAY87_009032 [Trapa incisa]